MEKATLITPLQVLDRILVINLNVGLWTARIKMTAEDLGGADLPPEDLASLGFKRVCNPAKLTAFTKLRARAVNLLNKNGVRFLSGWAIPEEKAGDIIQELCGIRDEYFVEKQKLLAEYETSVEEWITQHDAWAEIIKNSTVSRNYVDRQIRFAWQLYRVAPAAGLDSDKAMTESGLHTEVEGLGNTLFGEIVHDASDIWRKVYEGKSEVTHRALSPLKTLRNKLHGLTFVEPHVAPIVTMIDAALSKMPKLGPIKDTDLLLIQGVVSLLKDQEALLSQTQALLTAADSDNTLNVLLEGFEQSSVLPAEVLAAKVSASKPVKISAPKVESMGLW